MMRRINVTLGDSAIRMLYVVGEGNLSEGIRRAARIAYDKHQSSNAKEHYPPGSLRYRDDEKGWVMATPHNPMYSTMTMIATEYWHEENGWTKIAE